jgi:PIN domain nuclease of toxin-antitoxin system
VTGYLLDTNVLIAIINDTVDRLPRRIRDLMTSRDFAPAVSVVSPWEIAIKTGAGKLQMAEDIADIAAIIPASGCTVLPMTMAHALEVARPEPATRDPFDRLLLAVCACEGLKLVTTDSLLAGHRLVW